MTMPGCGWAPRLLEFWFEELDSGDWFKPGPSVDQAIRERFEPTLIAMGIAIALASIGYQTAFASSKLSAAAREGSLDDVRALIAAGTAVNEPDPDGTTPLLWAATKNAPIRSFADIG